MLEIIKRMDCHSYLIVSPNITHIKPAKLSMRVRWKVKSRLKEEGFIPFLTGWHIKPLYKSGDELVIRKRLKKDKYELPVKLTFLYVRGEDFKQFEIMELDIEQGE